MKTIAVIGHMKNRELTEYLLKLRRQVDWVEREIRERMKVDRRQAIVLMQGGKSVAGINPDNNIISFDPYDTLDCECGNLASSDGFWPVLDDGILDDDDLMKHAESDEWTGLYKCYRCGQLYQQKGEI